MKILRDARERWATAVAAAAVAVACGGTVSDGSARAELEKHADERCGSACEGMLTCDPDRFAEDTGDCTCGCGSCRPGEECICPPCDCGSPPSSSSPAEAQARCLDSCREDVTDLLDDDPDCDDELLAVLQCLARDTCEEDRCDPQLEILEDCRRASSSEPDPQGTPTSPGVTCDAIFTGGSGGPATPAPGSTVCNNGWDGCSDGLRYEVSCLLQPDGSMVCRCLVGEETTASFVAERCTQTTEEANTRCDWALR
ncbi:MAG: hypothetical protein FJ104_00210 [Deltaproteobacteria bacterium]|nr:hypothetical protein [Deltaproteobacteria bacterium]